MCAVINLLKKLTLIVYKNPEKYLNYFCNLFRYNYINTKIIRFVKNFNFDKFFKVLKTNKYTHTHTLCTFVTFLIRS